MSRTSSKIRSQKLVRTLCTRTRNEKTACSRNQGTVLSHETRSKAKTSLQLLQRDSAKPTPHDIAIWKKQKQQKSCSDPKAHTLDQQQVWIEVEEEEKTKKHFQSPPTRSWGRSTALTDGKNKVCIFCRLMEKTASPPSGHHRSDDGNKENFLQNFSLQITTRWSRDAPHDDCCSSFLCLECCVFEKPHAWGLVATRKI